MSLAEVQDVLRALDGTTARTEDERKWRQALWRRIDESARARVSEGPQ
jgi:hypothetical protein